MQTRYICMTFCSQCNLIDNEQSDKEGESEEDRSQNQNNNANCQEDTDDENDNNDSNEEESQGNESSVKLHKLYQLTNFIESDSVFLIKMVIVFMIKMYMKNIVIME